WAVSVTPREVIAAEALASSGFAVVEFFTSEGCSSCPPADEVLAALDRHARRTGSPIYAVGYHVDYWDGLGWPDRFGDPAHSARQRRYARALASGRSYTPQAVVNGAVEFVGSDVRRMVDTVAAALDATPAVTLTATFDRSDVQKTWFRVDADGLEAGKDYVATAVRTLRSATSAVDAGENRGRTLSHVNIVREAATAELDADGTATIALSRTASDDEEEVVVWVSETAIGPIVAATRVDPRQ
ncbi:MAG: DUF1223 domain-containing protein, partial [Planctomycetota bacterium]